MFEKCPPPVGPHLRQKIDVTIGSSISRTNADSQWDPVYKAFHESVLIQAKQLVGSNPNVMYMQETCGQRSGMAAGSKHRALAFYFSRN